MQSKPPVTDPLGVNTITESTGWKGVPEFILLPPKRVVPEYGKETGGHNNLTYTALWGVPFHPSLAMHEKGEKKMIIPVLNT